MDTVPHSPFESTLKELFGGELRYRVLRALFERPGREFHLRGLANAAHVDSGNAHRMLKKLIDAGLCEQTQDAPYPKYRARQDNPLFPDLNRLFSRASDLMEAIRLVANEIPGTVAIFGSVARGDDRLESDIDVLVIGPISTVLSQAAFKPVERAYGQKINVIAISEHDLRNQIAAGSAFWRDVLVGPLIKLKGEIPDEVARGLFEGREPSFPSEEGRSIRYSQLDSGGLGQDVDSQERKRKARQQGR